MNNLSKTSISLPRPICLHIQVNNILIPKQGTQMIMDPDKQQERFIILAVTSRLDPNIQLNLMHITGKICFSNSVSGRMSTRILCRPRFQRTSPPQCRIIWKTLIASRLAISNNNIKSYSHKDNYITHCTLRVTATSPLNDPCTNFFTISNPCYCNSSKMFVISNDLLATFCRPYYFVKASCI